MKPAYFCAIRKCKVRKPRKYGGKKYEKLKFCFSVLSDRDAGFLISSKPRESDILQMAISPEEINPHVPDALPDYCKLKTISYANLSDLKIFDEKEVLSAVEICPIPYSVAEKIIEELEKILPNRNAKKIIQELKFLIRPSR